MSRRSTIVSGGEAHASPLGTRSVSTWTSPSGDTYARGDQVRVQGRHGLFSFYEHTSNDLGEEWVTFYKHQFESVTPDKIRRK